MRKQSITLFGCDLSLRAIYKYNPGETWKAHSASERPPDPPEIEVYETRLHSPDGKIEVDIWACMDADMKKKITEHLLELEVERARDA